MLSRAVSRLRPRFKLTQPTKRLVTIAIGGGTIVCAKVALCDAPAITVENDEEYDTPLEDHLEGRMAVYLARAR